jgi:hypothetical protein
MPDHVWTDEHGIGALWRGWHAWYYRDPTTGEGIRLCDAMMNDGDAITCYRAKMRLLESARIETEIWGEP